MSALTCSKLCHVTLLDKCLLYTNYGKATGVRSPRFGKDLLVKGTGHRQMKVIGGKTTVKTSATSSRGRLTKSWEEEDEDEQFDLSAVFSQQVWQCIFATWGYHWIGKVGIG